MNKKMSKLLTALLMLPLVLKLQLPAQTIKDKNSVMKGKVVEILVSIPPPKQSIAKVQGVHLIYKTSIVCFKILNKTHCS